MSLISSVCCLSFIRSLSSDLIDRVGMCSIHPAISVVLQLRIRHSIGKLIQGEGVEALFRIIVSEALTEKLVKSALQPCFVFVFDIYPPQVFLFPFLLAVLGVPNDQGSA